MIRLSDRYALPALLLALAALVPIAFHSLRELRADDCADPAALRDTSTLGPVRDLIERGFDWHNREYIVQYTQGKVPVDARYEPVHFSLVRSFDPSYLWLKPTAFVRQSEEVRSYTPQLRWIDTPTGALPVRVVHIYSIDMSRVVAYFFAYGNEAVASPFGAQLASAVPQIFRGVRPMTLYVADARGPRTSEERLTEMVLDWIRTAWVHYRSACVAREAARAS